MRSSRMEQVRALFSKALAGLGAECSYGEALAALAQGLFLWQLKAGGDPGEFAAWGGPFAVPAWRGCAPAAIGSLQAELTRLAPSPEELGLALEALHWEHSAGSNKERGAYYTPAALAHFMARLALRLYFQELAQPRSRGRAPEAPVALPPTWRLADPAVGVGAFLTAALAELSALPSDLRGGRSALDLISCLAGRDRDPEAVYLTRVRLWLLVAEEVARRGGPFPPLTAVCTGDSLAEVTEPADIVLENPPYLRQESLSAAEKDTLAARFGRSLPRQADLYAYFLANLRNELKPGGVAVLVTPVAWLEVDYGRALQRELLRTFEIPLILTSACERWFHQAAVHTAVSAFVRPEEEKSRPGRPTALVKLSRPLVQAAEEVLAVGGRFPAGWSHGETFQAVNLPRRQLSALTQRKSVVRARWGTILRAPGAYFTLHAATPDAWVSAGEVAEVTRGFTSGANAFFFVRDVTAEVGEDLRAELGVTEGRGLRVIAARGRGASRYFAVEERFLFPLIKTPREVSGYTIREADLPWRVLLLPPDEEYLQGLRVVKYVRWGEAQGFNRRATVCSRPFWWSLPKLLPPQVLARQFYDRRFNFPYNPGAALCDHTFYYLTGCADPELFAALLNSSLTYLHVELWGRSNMGDGVLTFYGPELADLPLPRPELFSDVLGAELKRAFQRLAARPVLTIEREIEQSDRRDLDLAVLAGLGLTSLPAASLLAEIYTALTQLVAQRLARSRRGPGV